MRGQERKTGQSHFGVRPCRWIAVIACLLSGLTIAPAALAETFTGSGSGIFGVPSGGGPGIVYSGVGTNRIETGTPATIFDLNNALQYDTLAFVSIPEDTPFSVGLLTYQNGATLAGTSATHLPIDIELEFDAPPGLPNQVFSFAFDLELVPNNQIPPDDILTVPTAFPDQFFTHNSVNYTLKLLGFSTDGGATFRSEFVLPENRTVQSNLMATITTENPNVIPLPAAAWMGMALLGSIGGAGFFRQRRLGLA